MLGDPHRVSDSREAPPPTLGLTISCSEKQRSKRSHQSSSRWQGAGGWVRLSPARTFLRLVGARGFEPRTFPIRDRDAPAGGATVSPAFSKEMVGARGFEPRTSCAQGKTIRSILLILPAFSASSITI